VAGHPAHAAPVPADRRQGPARPLPARAAVVPRAPLCDRALPDDAADPAPERRLRRRSRLSSTTPSPSAPPPAGSWGSCDLAYTRFSGRLLEPPAHAGTIPRATHDAEQACAGFLPGDESFPEAAFFACLWPKPEAIETAEVRARERRLAGQARRVHSPLPRRAAVGRSARRAARVPRVDLPHGRRASAVAATPGSSQPQSRGRERAASERVLTGLHRRLALAPRNLRSQWLCA
jgi:hypothetical protein